MTTDELRESLLYAPKNGYSEYTPEKREAMNEYCKRYAAFINACKTEREATASSSTAPVQWSIPVKRSSFPSV